MASPSTPEFKSAPGSFLFSLNKCTKYEIYQNKEKAIVLIVKHKYDTPIIILELPGGHCHCEL